MCGITGIYYKNRERAVDGADISIMRDTMVHRGPDDAGIYLSGNVGLGHRRLSIVGLSSGHQPMSNEAGTVWIVFNGEIYNYPELKITMESKGYRFRTQSDTEVIIHLFEEYGENCVHHLNGMFAFAIWDKNNRRLFLARDRLGIKPFYYAEVNGALIFGSEIKAVLAYPGFQTDCDRDSVFEYFLFRAVSGKRTMFEGVRSLLPGHCLLVTEEKTVAKQYWEHCSRQPLVFTFNEAVERLEELLVDAVRLRLMSEVPLGTFCSGGIDSSLVTAIAAKAIGHPINTFSVGFYESDFDEGYFARLVSSEYGTNHHELKLTNKEYAQLLPDLIYLNDEPLNFQNSIHIFAISQLAKKHVTVVLTGEGADELFFGYPRYKIPQLVSNLKRFKLIAGFILKNVGTILNDHRIEKLLYFLDKDLSDIIKCNAAVNKEELIDQIMIPGIFKKDLSYRNELFESIFENIEVLECLSLQDQLTYLVSILNRQDKMSMGASVEARVPFLDYRIVEFANLLPGSLRMKGHTSKLLVKEVAKKYLPMEVVNRKKSGFGVPLKTWLQSKGGMAELIEDTMFDSDGQDYFDRNYLLKIYREHRSGKKDYSEMIWTVVNFILWKKCFKI
ncbi:asparagine synthase (glutamine-hydrolyzing) [Desulfofustis limnaeus]|uniref:asparagine synthase (glutamine-hydrolyzing) n=1 Tax=Desulfofustis limnaeus TaxID=2740163 RepID=A0ABN6M7Q3_9BACT|nr:asparagine synthase (glutamine-hydrolyzing) [Desulfofustis limnaeus]BDD87613.1 asparagine synthetase B [Desulfofustis limnaeus]